MNWIKIDLNKGIYPVFDEQVILTDITQSKLSEIGIYEVGKLLNITLNSKGSYAEWSELNNISIPTHYSYIKKP